MIFRDINYPKGFVITQGNPNIKDTHQIDLGNYVLSYGDDVSINSINNNKHIILIGYVMDTHFSNAETKDILNALDQADEQERHMILNRLNGRYIYIERHQNKLLVYPDATTMLPIYYHTKYMVIGSHSLLVKEIVDELYQFSGEIYGNVVNGFMDFTRFQDIFKLNPNMYIDLVNNELKRFFPSEEFKENSTSYVLEQTTKLFENMKDWLQKQDIYITITGGIDSRVSLAVMKNKAIPLLNYFNISQNQAAFSKKTYENDLMISKQMAEDLDLDLTILNIGSNSNVKPETLEKSKIYESKHSYSLSEQLKESRFEGKLHMKSNVFELAKLPVSKIFYEHDSFEFIEELKTKIPASLSHLDKEELIAEYMERNQLSRETIKNHYFGDIYYHEQRLGNWHSNITQETDDSVDVFILLNTRELIQLITSAPIDIREKMILQKEWINHFWPVLNFYPMNSKRNLFERYQMLEQQLKEQKLKIYGPSISYKNGAIIPQFPMHDTNYEFTVFNHSDLTQKFFIKSHYSNPKGRGKLFFEYDGNKVQYQDMNDGLSIEIASNETKTFKIVYDKIYENQSWQKAGKLTIE